MDEEKMAQQDQVVKRAPVKLQMLEKNVVNIIEIWDLRLFHV